MNISLSPQTIPMSWQDYIAKNFDRSTIPWDKYRWIQGEIIPVGGEGKLNSLIAMVLGRILDRYIEDHDLEWTVFVNHLEVEVDLSEHQTRIPDLMVVSNSVLDGMGNEESVITKAMAPPILVVEIVSPSSVKDDYQAKELEYLDRGIQEYVNIDWKKEQIIVRSLTDGRSYNYVAYKPGDRFSLTSFPKLTLNVDQVLSGKKLNRGKS